MKKIGWPQIFFKKYGGTVYGDKVKDILSKDFDLELIDFSARHLKNHRYLKAVESLFYLFKLRGNKDVWLRDFYSTITLNRKRTSGKNISLIFHVDFSGYPLISRLPFYVLEKVFLYRQLKKVDAIVAMSGYWEEYFLGKGYKNVYKIYCGFDLADFNISEKELTDFKKKYKLEGKPIIYLGNCQKAKGVVDSYNALKGINAYFVTSGKRDVKIPALHLDLDYREYLALLKSADIALAMSKFKEGWCMTAHEAMLLKTPVIGSGKGGMKELLEGGKQIVCGDFGKLLERVEFLLNNPEQRKKMGEAAYDFAKSFTMERFKESWVGLINKLAVH